MENIDKRKKQLLAKYSRLLLVSFFGSFLLNRLSGYGSTIALPFIELILRYLGMQESIQTLFSTVSQIYLSFLPLFPYIYCMYKRFEIFSQLEVLSEEKPEQMEEHKREEKKQDDDSMIQDILTRFNSLPRGKQMELLNYIKGLDLDSCNDLANKISILDENEKNLLQTCMEDSLFPDYPEASKKRFSRKRTIENEKGETGTLAD